MSQPTLRIGEVARLAGVNVQTLRYYERRRLLEPPKRSDAGLREYPPETVRLIRFIKRAQDLGFTLKEIQELIALRETRGRDRSLVRELAASKLADVDQKIGRLRAIRKAVATLVEACACRGRALECPILEALDDDRLVGQRRSARGAA